MFETLKTIRNYAIISSLMFLGIIILFEKNDLTIIANVFILLYLEIVREEIAAKNRSEK